MKRTTVRASISPTDIFLMPVRPKKSTSANTSRIRKMRSKWIEKETGKPIRSAKDVEALDAEWSEKCEDAFCYLHEFEVIS